MLKPTRLKPTRSYNDLREFQPLFENEPSRDSKRKMSKEITDEPSSNKKRKNLENSSEKIEFVDKLLKNGAIKQLIMDGFLKKEIFSRWLSTQKEHGAVKSFSMNFETKLGKRAQNYKDIILLSDARVQTTRLINFFTDNEDVFTWLIENNVFEILNPVAEKWKAFCEPKIRTQESNPVDDLDDIFTGLNNIFFPFNSNKQNSGELRALNELFEEELKKMNQKILDFENEKEKEKDPVPLIKEFNTVLSTFSERYQQLTKEKDAGLFEFIEQLNGFLNKTTDLLENQSVQMKYIH